MASQKSTVALCLKFRFIVVIGASSLRIVLFMQHFRLAEDLQGSSFTLRVGHWRVLFFSVTLNSPGNRRLLHSWQALCCPLPSDWEKDGGWQDGDRGVMLTCEDLGLGEKGHPI